MGFPRQEYWSGLPFPSPGNLLDPWFEPTSPAFAGRFFTTKPPGKRLELEPHFMLHKIFHFSLLIKIIVMCVHIIGEKLCRCTQAINIKQFQTHADCSQTPFVITISLSTYWAGLHLCRTWPRSTDSLPLSCLVCEEVSGSLLRTDRKTDSGWTFWCRFLQRMETEVWIHNMRTGKPKSWRHWPIIYNDMTLGFSAWSSSWASWSLLSQCLETS